MAEKQGIEYLYHVLRAGKPLSYFNRFYMFLFLPLVVIIYNLMPKKIRPYILLISSLILFYLFSEKLVFYLIISIVSIFVAGLLMSRVDSRKEKILNEADKDDKKKIKKKYKNYKKLVLIIAILFNLSFLVFFKYLPFFKTNGNLLLHLFNIDYSFKIIKHIAPIGISYYTLEAISYLVDIYNEKIKADDNIFRVALYLSFFPGIMEGPIARYSDTAEKLFAGNKVTYKNFCFGYQRVFWGLLKKAVIANRINIVVKTVFSSYTSYSGLPIVLAVIGYTIMLYAEFSGTMDIVIGSAEMFDVKMPENFRQPFFAKNVSEFWTRWHITLGTWFKDYIYYPISLSKPLKKLTVKTRKLLGNHYGPLISGAVALLVVWFLNGLWHGAGYTYLFFGLYHFVMILGGSLIEPLTIKLCKILHINRKNIVYRVFQSVKMTIFVFIGELFFRAPDLNTGFGMLKKGFTDFNFKALSNGEVLSLGLDHHDYIILGVTLVVVFIIGLIKEKGIDVRENISKRNIVIRWALYYALILAIIIFGAYGTGYAPVDPIYADF